MGLEKVLLKASVRTSQAQFNFKVICWKLTAESVVHFVSIVVKGTNKQWYCIVPMQAKYVHIVKTVIGHHRYSTFATCEPSLRMNSKNENLTDHKVE